MIPYDPNSAILQFDGKNQIVPRNRVNPFP